jgi:hypothetical protein
MAIFNKLLTNKALQLQRFDGYSYSASVVVTAALRWLQYNASKVGIIVR